jgi:hypothetical protein
LASNSRGRTQTDNTIANSGQITSETDHPRSTPQTPTFVNTTHKRRYSTPAPIHSRRKQNITYTVFDPRKQHEEYDYINHARKTREVINKIDTGNEARFESTALLNEIYAKDEKIDDTTNKLKQIQLATLCVLISIIFIFTAYHVYLVIK